MDKNNIKNHTHSEYQVYAKQLADHFQVAQQVLCKLYHVERPQLWHHHHPVSQPLFTTKKYMLRIN